MKKILSLLLAVLMLSLPVFSGAEQAAPSLPSLSSLASAGSFATKYLLEGQRGIADISIQPGEGLLQMLPEEFRTAVRDLLGALKFEVSAQHAEQNTQASLRLLLNDESAIDLTGALGGKTFYAASNLLGDQIIRFTPAQIKGLLNQLLEQQVAQGRIPQAQVDLIKKAYRALKNDPVGTLVSMIGSPDLTGLLTALGGLMNSIAVEEVKELPEEVTIDAQAALVLTLKKDTLKEIASELSKVLWSMPGVQKLAANIPVNGQPMTEERFNAIFSRVPEMLAEDAVMKIYLNEDASRLQILSDIKLQKDGQVLTEHVNVLVEVRENGLGLKGTAKASGENVPEIIFDYGMDLTVSGEDGSLTFNMKASQKDGEKLFTPIEENAQATWTLEETRRTVQMDTTASILPTADAQPVTVGFQMTAEERDLGDHAEENATMAVSMSNIGELLSFTVNARTDLAEAYIITEDAVEPLASETGMQELGQKVLTNAQMTLISLIGKLPESVQSLFVLLSNPGAQ